MSIRSIPAAMALAVLTLGGIGSTDVAAQRLPLRPTPAGGFPIIPIMEGWWDNGDGSYTVSFGYHNRNRGAVEISIGQRNSIEPARYSGMQPTAFLPGRHHGVFTVTFPAGTQGNELLWSIESNGEVLSVPGRTVSAAYQLDRNPRPHGTVAPLLRFDEGGEAGQYPPGIVASRVETVPAGQLLTLTVHVEDPSVRDPTDRRFREALASSATWYKHQGPPGEIEWVRHPSTPLPTPAEGAAGDNAAAGGGGPAAGAGGAGGRRQPQPPSPDVVAIPQGKGAAMVQARFPAPGEYMLRVRVDQFGSAPDSSAGNQCCWTNGYVRVRVTQ